MVFPLYAMFLLLLLVEFVAGINLSSTQSEQGACLGDVIVFTCTVTGAGILEWKLDNTLVAFINTQGLSHLESLPDVNVTLITVETESLESPLGNLTSELTVFVSQDTIQKRVYCDNGKNNASSIIKKQCKLKFVDCSITSIIILFYLSYAAINLTVSQKSYRPGIGEYSFLLQLKTAPNITELKYSLINNNECLIMNMSIKNLNISIPGLMFNSKYSIFLKTVNCFNEENTTKLEISLGKTAY